MPETAARHPVDVQRGILRGAIVCHKKKGEEKGKQRARRYRDDARSCNGYAVPPLHFKARRRPRENSLYYVRKRRFTIPLRVRSQRNIKESDSLFPSRLGCSPRSNVLSRLGNRDKNYCHFKSAWRKILEM